MPPKSGRRQNGSLREWGRDLGDKPVPPSAGDALNPSLSPAEGKGALRIALRLWMPIPGSSSAPGFDAHRGADSGTPSFWSSGASPYPSRIKKQVLTG